MEDANGDIRTTYIDREDRQHALGELQKLSPSREAPRHPSYDSEHHEVLNVPRPAVSPTYSPAPPEMPAGSLPWPEDELEEQRPSRIKSKVTPHPHESTDRRSRMSEDPASGGVVIDAEQQRPGLSYATLEESAPTMPALPPSYTESDNETQPVIPTHDQEPNQRVLFGDEEMPDEDSEETEGEAAQPTPSRTRLTVGNDKSDDGSRRSRLREGPSNTPEIRSLSPTPPGRLGVARHGKTPEKQPSGKARMSSGRLRASENEDPDNVDDEGLPGTPSRTGKEVPPRLDWSRGRDKIVMCPFAI